MGDPAEYLPNIDINEIHLELVRIGFPPVKEITQLAAGGAYHRIFRLSFTPEDYHKVIQGTGHTLSTLSNQLNATNNALILRVSGLHIPSIKTANEVAIITYLNKHTSVPVPRVFHYEDTTDNKLGHEYMIMELLHGTDGTRVYHSLTQTQMSHILDQLVTICLELYKLDFEHIGGLKPGLNIPASQFPQRLSELHVVPGPPVMETMWQSPDIDRYFNKHSNSEIDPTKALPEFSFTSLNAISTNGYASYAAWLAAQMQVYIYTIQHHPSLRWVSQNDDNLAALSSFTHELRENTSLQTKLDNVPFKLAHRDLHFGNLLLSPDPTSTASETQYQITGILDWEFAGILPFPLWRYSFLRDGISSPPADFEGTVAEFWARSSRNRDRLYEQWVEKVRSLDRDADVGRAMLRDMEWRCREQAAAWDVVNYLRCIVEVCPRGTQAKDAREWWKEVVKALAVFGIQPRPSTG